MAAVAFSGALLGTLPITFVAIFVASGVGMGGGGILVPLFTLMLSVPSKVGSFVDRVGGFTHFGLCQTAVPLSNITIFGGSIVNVVAYLYRKHPKVSALLLLFQNAALTELHFNLGRTTADRLGLDTR